MWESPNKIPDYLTSLSILDRKNKNKLVRIFYGIYELPQICSLHRCIILKKAIQSCCVTPIVVYKELSSKQRVCVLTTGCFQDKNS